MNVGLLWFMNKQKSLGENVAQAASYYQKKFGQIPTLCLVNPKAISDQPEAQDGTEADAKDRIVVRPYRPVPPNHIWIGIEDAKKAGQ